ncbi:hypothetical protein ACJX0J_030996 [Zea mays]
MYSFFSFVSCFLNHLKKIEKGDVDLQLKSEYIQYIRNVTCADLFAQGGEGTCAFDSNGVGHKRILMGNIDNLLKHIIVYCTTANPKGDRTTGIWLEISRWVSV